MTPLRCLWVTRLVPYPPFIGGDATYSARLIESLVMAGVELTVLCHDNGVMPPTVGGVGWVLVPYQERGRARSLFGRRPALVHRFSTPQIRDALDALLRKRSWDALLIDNIAVAGALHMRRRARGCDRPTRLVYVSHNHEETIRKQLAATATRRSPKHIALRWDAAKTAAIERALVDAADLVTVNTEHDADLYRQHARDQRYLVLTPGYDGPGVGGRLIEAETPRRITLLGSYAWVAKQLNLWRFLDAGAESLARAGIGIDIVGWTPDAFAGRLRASFPGVEVTGPVDRVEPYLARARMGIVAEEVGGGFKHKVLHYVFNRLPVASLAGSVAGTPLVAGESMLEYPDIRGLVEGVIETIDDLARLNELQEAALLACNGKFEWADRGSALAERLWVLRSEEIALGRASRRGQ